MGDTTMNIFHSWDTIKLVDISTDSRWNLHPWVRDERSQELEESFRQTGILHPPVVMQSDEKYQLLCGYRRLKYAEQTGLKQISCGIVKKGTEPAALMTLILEDQKITGELSPVEKFRFLQLAEELGGEELKKYFIRGLGLSRKQAEVELLAQLHTQPIEILRDIHHNRLSLQIFAELQQLPNPEDRHRLLQLFREWDLGGGKQKRLFQQLRDCAGKEGKSIGGLLDVQEIQEILNHEQLNVPQKIQHLNATLQQHLLAESSAREKTFREEVRKLGLPSRAELNHSPSFERDDVTLSLTFPDMEACKVWLKREKK